MVLCTAAYTLWTQTPSVVGRTYWSYVLPGMLIGSGGMQVILLSTKYASSSFGVCDPADGIQRRCASRSSPGTRGRRRCSTAGVNADEHRRRALDPSRPAHAAPGRAQHVRERARVVVLRARLDGRVAARLHAPVPPK
jgi:hypothetical protein